MDAKRFTAVAFRMRMHFPIPSFAPSGNLIGGVLLAQVARDRLHYAEILAGPCLITGELNGCFGLMEVSDVTACVDILRSILAPLSLLELCEIGWLCTDEDVWKMASPDAIKGLSVPLGEFITDAMTVATYERVAQAKREIAKMKRRI